MDWFELGKLTEVPYLAAFIIFAVMLFKYFQRWSDKKDKMHIDRMEKSEGVWREFIKEQRIDFLNSIADITCALTEVKKKQEEHTVVIEQMKDQQEIHDKKLDIALAVLDAKKE